MRIALCLAAVLALLAAGCSRSTTFSSKDGEVTVSDKGSGAGTMTFTGKDGQKVTVDYGGTAMPGDYPKDVPVYSNVKVIAHQTASGNEGGGRVLMLQSSDAMDKIVDFYKKEMAGSGWATENTMSMNNMNVVTATKGNQQLSVQVTDGGDTRSITQTLVSK